MTIPLTYKEKLLSTSTTALNYLNMGYKPPFAIMAAQQTNGRGRYAHQWQSPKGGLYLSIAIEIDTIAKLSPQSIPLLCGLLIQFWFEEKEGLKISLKWPNDFYYAGRKLGGILCEGTFIGSEWKTLIIGIGINIEQAPETHDLVKSICLSQIKKRKYSLKELAESLLEYWQRNWTKNNLKQLSLASIAQQNPFQIWCEKEKQEELYLEEGIDDNASLILKRLSPPFNKTSLNSGSHKLIPWVCLHSSKEIFPLLIADVGNSTVKLACFLCYQSKEPELVLTWNNHSDLKELEKKIKQIKNYIFTACKELIKIPFPCFVGSVCPAKNDLLCKSLKKEGFILVLIRKKPILSKIKAYKLSELGLDRLALMEGFLSGKNNLSVRKKSFCLLVDIGTAITIDLIDEITKEHLGGMILPGPKLILETLKEKFGWELSVHNFLDHYENLENRLNHHFAKKTLDSVLLGIKAQIEGSILWARRYLLKENQLSEEDIKLIFTGGLSNKVLAEENNNSYEPYLVLKGLRTLVLGGVLK